MTSDNMRPMTLNIGKMRANNLNNFDLANVPDDVQINADGGAGAVKTSTAKTPATKPKINLSNINPTNVQAGVDTVASAANLAKGIKIRKSDEACGKRPLITMGKKGKAKLRAYNDCMASKGVSTAAIDTYIPPAPVQADDKIMGMPKMVFFGVASVAAIIIGVVVYKKFIAK